MGFGKALLWTFVASFFFLVAIALIEPLKIFTQPTIDLLSCTTTTDNNIKSVCFLIKGVVVLFVGGYIAYLIRGIWLKSKE